MNRASIVPNYALFGEMGGFPDLTHVERIIDRARIHAWKIRPHRHEQLAQIFVIQRGEAQCRVDGQSWYCSDQSIFYLPPHCIHGFEFARGTEGSVISLHSLILRNFSETQSGIADHLVIPWRGDLQDDEAVLVKSMFQANQSANRFRTERMLFLGQALLTCIAERFGSEAEVKGNRSVIRRLDALLSGRDGYSKGPAECAAALAVTTGHLNRMIKEATGTSLSVYIEGRRMSEACRLLVFTQLSVAEIGHRLGYHDPAYFSRRFRNTQGETPSGYRARLNPTTG